MNVLFLLLTCPVTRTEICSMELVVVQNHKHCSYRVKRVSGDIHSEEKGELVSLSLSLSFSLIFFLETCGHAMRKSDMRMRR